MKSIRVRNLRSFDNNEANPFIDIKPITIFVGKNSCGKSSLLRTFPLLRQSIEANTSGPILWYGQYVDYGAFSTAKNKNIDETSIFFDFKFDIKNHIRNASLRKRINIIDIELSLEVTDNKKSTVEKTLTIKVNNIVFIFDYFKKVLYIDGVPLKHSLLLSKNKGKFCTEFYSDFESDNKLFDFEELYFASQEDEEEDDYNIRDEYLLEVESKYMTHDAISRVDIRKILTLLKYDTNDFTTYSRIEEKYLESMSICNKEQLKEILITHSFISTDDIIEDETLDLIVKLNTICFLPKLIDKINLFFNNYSSSIKYIAPLRASAERFYRLQDLRVQEIDHTGSNLAMLLRSLTEYQMSNFQVWCLDNFGFKISVPETDNLYYEINITIDNETQNISDMGFGFSQILPIVTSLWVETVKNFRPNQNKNILFVIEQPELHLHPKFQSILSLVLAKVADYNRNARPFARKPNINIIFETHSKTMIDTIGDFIEENNCPELASIYIFEKENNNTIIKKSFYDNDGDLTNWPIGFFSGM